MVYGFDSVRADGSVMMAGSVRDGVLDDVLDGLRVRDEGQDGVQYSLFIFSWNAAKCQTASWEAAKMSDGLMEACKMSSWEPTTAWERRLWEWPLCEWPDVIQISL